MNCAIMIIF